MCDSRRARAPRAWLALVVCVPVLLANCQREESESPQRATEIEAAADVPGGLSGAVIFVVVDTLRADHLGTYGYPRATSEALDRWARSGRVFDHAFAPSPWTLPSMGSLLTGRWPAAHTAGVLIEKEPRRRFAVLASRRRGVFSLAERLSEAGRRSAAVVSNPYLGPQFGLDRGFEHYDAAKLENEQMRRADAGVEAALAWLAKQEDERFFLLLHLYDPHLRYDAPVPERGRFTKKIRGSSFSLPVEDVEAIRAKAGSLDDNDRAFVVAAYDEELAFVDRQIERVRAALEERGWLGNALVVLTSDHGEELFEHGGFEHGHALWQQLLHVPLVIWAPGVVPGRSPAPVSLVDVAPTVLEALGMPAGAARDGVSLWSHLRGGDAPPPRPLFAEGMYYGGERKAIVRWPHKLVLNPRNGLRRLVDLASDPAEEHAITAREPALADSLQAELTAYIEATTRPTSDVGEAEIGEELRRQLESLGYAQ